MAKLKVFINYCREDKEIARKLYDGLCALGVDAWLDEKKLNGGQSWSYEVSKAIKESNYFLALISKTSLAKRGHVQRELKQASEIQDSLPEGAVFVIPCKIEECALPIIFAHLHWIELYPDFASALQNVGKAIGLKTPAAASASTTSSRRRISLELSPDTVRKIEELRELLDEPSHASVLRNALSIAWAAARFGQPHDVIIRREVSLPHDRENFIVVA